ncbi:MAG: WYL domain-containing protein [Propionibacteriaceae bacterium]|jgi:proteasome accessory factor C|nr:WYL domain-containing protein [Propionibacteriaceae bacterium]
MGSSERVARLLALVPYLQRQGGFADLAQTAQMLGVSVEQLRKDVRLLQFVGEDMRSPGALIDIDLEGLNEGDIFLSNADFLSKPMRLSADEAVSLEVGLRALAELGGAEVSAAAKSALAKISAASAAAPIDMSLDAGEQGAALEKAAAENLVVEIGYQRGGEERHARIEPKRLSAKGGHVYLQAWNIEAGGWRSYRTDRITSVQATEERGQARGEPPALDDSWLSTAKAQKVKVKLAPEAAWVEEYWPTTSVVHTDGGLEVELNVVDPNWFAHELLRLGPAVLGVDPREAAAGAAQLARQALENYKVG